MFVCARVNRSIFTRSKIYTILEEKYGDVTYIPFLMTLAVKVRLKGFNHELNPAYNPICWHLPFYLSDAGKISEDNPFMLGAKRQGFHYSTLAQ